MIEVLNCAPLTSIQDLGRPGLRHLGIARSGAMDPMVTQQLNLLLGNSCNAAVIEFSMGRAMFRFHEDALIALSGADCRARLLDSEREPITAEYLMPGYQYRIKADTVLQLSGPSGPNGRCYLAIRGGIQVPLVLGSRSTDLNNRFGGLQGRPLQAGDVLGLGDQAGALPSSSKGIRAPAADGQLRAIRGPEYDLFQAQARADLWQELWRVSRNSNRMGLRLEGASLQLDTATELTSSPVLPGIIQVPADGKPIILANDAQTMGGYPRIATIINADLWQLAYLPPTSRIRLREVTLEEAQEASAHNRLYLERLERTLHEQ